MSQISLGYQGIAAFTLTNPIRSDGGEIISVEATIEKSDLEARARVWANYQQGFDDLIQFLEDLASNWSGWTGKKSYQSLEGELILSASNSGVGPVQLTVRLRGPDQPSDWELTATIETDPGTQMEEAAKSASEFLVRFEHQTH